MVGFGELPLGEDFGVNSALVGRWPLGHAALQMASDDKGVQIEYNTSLQPLGDLLAGVKRPGDYFSSGAVETPMPTLSVEGVGVVSFPVPPTQARELIAVAAERAPYGRGDRTLVDESVRKVWQIPPDKITLCGTGWERTLAAVTGEVAADLGCEPAAVTIEFYKLLIYDEGGFFAAHRDTEKAPGMFGTLVITLPSAHEGGNLIIRHAGRETVVSLRNEEPGAVRYAAFYTDCEHEVKPVVVGHRVGLIYNLIWKAGAHAPEPPDHRPAVAAAADILRPWVATDDDPEKLVYLLEHHYTQAALSFAALKGADAARAAVLRDAAIVAGCAVHLGIVHVEESGWAEYDGWGDTRSRGRRYWEDDEDEDFEEEDQDESEDYEVGEVTDGRAYIDQWRDAADQPVDLGEVPLGEEEVLPAGALEGALPDDQHFSEATGNAGASFERTYLRAALVLWPLARADEVCASAGLDAAITRLGQLVEAAGDPSGGLDLRRRVAEFAERLTEAHWADYEDQGKRIDTLLGHLARFGDASLIAPFAPLWTFHYRGARNPALLAVASVMGPDRVADLTESLFDKVAVTRPDGCLEWWCELADSALVGNPVRLAGLYGRLLEIAPEISAHPPTPKPTHPQPHRRMVFESSTPPHRRPEPIQPETLVRFLGKAQAVLGTSDVQALLSAAVRNPSAFPPGPLLVPATELLVRASSPLPLISELWRAAAESLLARSETPPPEPVDWTQTHSIPGSANDPLLRELVSFARDPAAREHRFRVATEGRGRLHHAIDEAGLDMTHVTERRGRPYTLVCAKTRWTYENACAVHRADLADMERLLKLQPAESGDDVAALARRQRAALVAGPR